MNEETITKEDLFKERIELLKRNEELQLRIEKAVEYLKEHEYDIRNNFDYYVKGSELLNILNGKE